MTNEQAYKLIGERAQELSESSEVQQKMLEIAKSENKEAAEKFLYSLAIATLCITPEEFKEYSENIKSGQSQ